jgi:hypothetical protein
MVVDDEMELTAVNQLVPGAFEREWRAGDFLQPQNAAVEALRPFDVGHTNGDVIERCNLEHKEQIPNPTPPRGWDLGFGIWVLGFS